MFGTQDVPPFGAELQQKVRAVLDHEVQRQPDRLRAQRLAILDGVLTIVRDRSRELVPRHPVVISELQHGSSVPALPNRRAERDEARDRRAQWRVGLLEHGLGRLDSGLLFPSVSCMRSRRAERDEARDRRAQWRVGLLEHGLARLDSGLVFPSGSGMRRRREAQQKRTDPAARSACRRRTDPGLAGMASGFHVRTYLASAPGVPDRSPGRHMDQRSHPATSCSAWWWISASGLGRRSWSPSTQRSESDRVPPGPLQSLASSSVAAYWSVRNALVPSAQLSSLGSTTRSPLTAPRFNREVSRNRWRHSPPAATRHDRGSSSSIASGTTDDW